MDTRALVLLSLVATALAGPISYQGSKTCSTKCIDSTKFRYAPGTTYTYDYRVDTETSMAGASEDTAKLTLQTIGEIEVLSPCELSLQLRNTRLFHTDGNGNLKTADREVQFRSRLEAYPLRFSYQDSKVEHVCRSDSDDVWALNLKKGFLSALQNTMDDLAQSQNVTETDVAGTCKTEYTVLNNGYYTTSLKKTKDILSCTDRHNFQTMIQTTSYFIPSDVQALPLMKTTHECEQSIEAGGVLKSTVCSETHVYRPFANGLSGGSTKVTQKLTYKTYKKGTSSRSRTMGSQDSLTFDHTASQPTKDQARFSVEQKLGAICDDTMNDIRPESPRLFYQLMEAMRAMDADDMEDIYHLLKTKTLCPSNNRAYKFFLDALPMTNTPNSVRLMSKLIDNADVEGLQAKAWLTALAFIPQPTSEMVRDVKSLVDNKKVRDDALLPVSSLINNYCRQKDSCDQDKAVFKIITSFERIIGHRCDASGKNFEKVLLTLRAIGNAGHFSRATRVLEKCITTSNPMEIRIAAIEAFRRMPCTEKSKNLWDMLMDRSLDSELRISAYMALMRCPTEESLNKMVALLLNEDNEHVGAFMYSHLTNLKESSNPHKQEVATMLKSLSLDKEFDLSPHKVSRTYEISTLINKLNTGFTAESNMIWSSTDQLPRSIAGNLTVELFGQSINLFDFGGRMEGLEYLLRNVFGPYINANEKPEKEIDFEKVQGSVFGRIFGNEMFFLNSKTAKSPFGNMPSKWLNVLIKLAKKQQVALTQNVQFIDACMVIPTSAGMPVQTYVNGTATVDLSISGKMDLRKVGASPRSMDVDGEVRPSAALEVTGTMAVDAFVTKTGLRMRNTMYSSTSLKGRIQLNRGQQLSIEMDTPEDKMEIFGAKSQFFILHNDIEQEQKMIKDNRKEFEMCSGTKMATITGMELCGQLSFPNASLQSEGPYFPLTGPSAISVTLFKRDTHSSYKLFAKRIENKKASIAQFSVKTSGSKVDRAITFDTTLNYVKQMVEANLFSPWKKAEIKGNLINVDGMKSVTGRVVIDETNVYAITSEVKTVQEKNKIQFSPMIEVKRPGANNVQLFGSIALERPMKSLDIDMTLTGIQKLPYTVKSTIINTKKQKSLSASFSSDDKNVYTIEASNQFSVMGKKAIIAALKTKLNINTPTKRLVAISGTADYRQDKLLKTYASLAIHRFLKKPATLQVTLVKNAKKKGSRFDLDVTLKSSRITTRLDSNMFMKQSGFISTRASLDYNIPKVDKNKIVFAGKFNDRSTKAYKKYSVKGNFDVKQNPEYNMGIVLDLDHKKKHSEAEMDFKYGANPKDKTKKIYFLTSLTKKISNPRNALVNYKIKVQAPVHKVDVFLTGKHLHTPKTLDSSVQLKYGKNKNFNAGLALKDQSTKLAKLNGKMNVEWPGAVYTVNSQLTQKSAKQYSHVLNFKSNSGTKHTISTIYKTPKAKTYDIRTEVTLRGTKPITFTGSTTLNWRNFAASVKALSGKDTYGLITTSKFTKAPNGKISMELIHPARRMTLDVNGGKIKNKYDGSIEAAWDAGKKGSKIILDGAYLQKSFKGAVSLGGNLNFRSPFTNFEDLLASFKYGSDTSEHNIDGIFSWGGKAKQVVASTKFKKDFSLKNIDITVGLKTPFKRFRNAEISIDHKMGGSLNSVLKGNLEKESAKLVIQGADQSDNSKTDVKGNLALRSTLQNAKVITATISHTLNNGKLLTSAGVNHNGQKYEIDINMAHNANGWQIKNSGDVTVKASKKKITAKWTHSNTDNAMKCSLLSNWGKNSLKVDFTGAHELSQLRQLNADLKIKSPWTVARNVEISVDHKHGNGFVKNNAFLKQNGKTKISSKINLKGDKNAAGVDFELKTPVSEDISGKLNAQYEKYPMTSFAKLVWAPKKKAALEGSINLASWNNADANVKLTTSSRKYSQILFRASNKEVNDEIRSNLVLDYGVRQSIDLESRMAYNAQKMFARVKLMSPFDNIKSLETGLSFDGSLCNFDTRADFEMLPRLGKFETLINWQYQEDMNGKIRVNTPFKDYPYFEVSTSSMMKSDSRQSRIQLEYYPRQTFSLDTTYKFDLPLSFVVTVKSPYPEYDNLGLSVQHNHADTFIRSHGEIKYQSDAKIEGDLNTDWSSNIDGSLVVKTPFENWENNQISLRHKEGKNSFSTHGEIFVALKKIVLDASLKTGFTTSGTFTFTSPVPGLENIKATIKKRGTMDNIKGGLVLTVNKDKAQANFNNKMGRSSMKSGLTITTPYSETLKLTLDHEGPAKSFTNKVSLNYGRKVDIDTVASFDLREPHVSGNAMLKYKAGKGRNTAKVSFKKNGPLEDLSFIGTASLNRDDITVSGSLKTLGEIDGTLSIKTPFENFKATGMTLSHKGDLTDFQTNANINYMDDKTIDGKIELSNLDGKKIRFLSQLSTPFKQLRTSTLEFNNQISERSRQINGNIVLTTTMNKFGSGNIVYSKSGDLNNLMIDTSVTRNGKDLATLKVTNNVQENELHSKFVIKSVATPAATFSIDHAGDFFNFNTKAVATVGTNTLSSEAKLKRSYQSFDADSLILFRSGNSAEKKCSLNVHTDGSWERCNLCISGMLNDDEVKLQASRQGPMQDMSFNGMASYNGKSIDVNGSWKNQADIDGQIDIQTPFENFNNIGMTLSHSGDASKFTSSATLHYMDNKKITGNVELTAYSFENIQFNTRLSTPFENYEYADVKFNNIYDRYTTDVSGNVALSTPIAIIGTKEIRYSKTGTLNNLKMDVVSTDNGMEVSSLKIFNDIYGQEIHSLFDLKSSVVPKLTLAVDHSGDLSNLKTIAKGQFGKANVVTGEVTTNVRDDTIDGKGKFMYSIPALGPNQGSLKIHKEGQMDDITVGVTATIGKEIYQLNGHFKNKEDLGVSITLNTPVENFKDVGLSFQHIGNLERCNCDAKIEVMDGMVFTGKMYFYRYMFRRIETVIEVTTPFEGYEFTKYEYRHEGEQDSFKCTSSLQYGDSNNIIYDLTASSAPHPDFTLSIKTPSSGVSSSGSLQYTWPKYAVKVRVDGQDGRILFVDGTFDATGYFIGSLTVNTPLQHFTAVGLGFSYKQRNNGFESNGQVTYMDGKTISGKIEISLSKKGRSELSAQLRTPFSGYEFIKFEQIQILNKKLFKTTSTLVYGNAKTIVYEITSTRRPKQEFAVSLKTPFENYEEMMAFVAIDSSEPKFGLSSKINAGNGNIYSLTGSFQMSADISGALNIATPYEGFTDIGMDFLHSRNDEKFSTEGKVTYMDGKDISGKLNVYRYMWRRIIASTELNTPFIGMENTKAEINFEDNSNSISTIAAVEYGADNKLNGNIKLTYSPNYDVIITLNIPFNDYKLIRTQGSLDMTAPSYEVAYSLDAGNKLIRTQGSLDMTAPSYEVAYSLDAGNNHVYSASGKVNLFSLDDIDASLEMNTPIIGYEYSKADYSHKMDSSEIDGSVSVMYMNGQKMSAELKTSLTPNFDATVIVKTPFTGFENMQGSATFEHSFNRYETSSSLNLGRGERYSISSDIDYSSFPMRASAKVNTPYTDFRNIELTLTHDGELNNFMSTGLFTSPLTDDINARAGLKYMSLFDMAASASLQSSMSGLDDLKAEVKMSDAADTKKAHLLMGWTSGQEVIIDGTYKHQDSWYENKVNTDFSVSTPFPAVRNLAWLMETTSKSGLKQAWDLKSRFINKMNIELNGDNLLDVDSDFKSKDKPEIQISFRKPWPMLYTASMSRDSESTEADVVVNWNRNEPSSNIHLLTTMTDKSNDYQTDNSFDLRVTRASRQIGIVHKINVGSTETSSKGKIFWDTDDSSQVSYDLQINENTRRRKQIIGGSFKLGLPSRTLGLTSIYSGNHAVKSADLTFSWDVDRDESKQIGLTANSNQGDNIKGDILLRLPSLRKEIHVDGEVMLKNGRIIFDTKTDFSYSEDTRKTLTLTSKFTDVSDYYSNYNYSLSLGVSHPYTNLDVKIDSHIGNSDERTTFGMNTNYLTAKRQIKNLALLAEINQLKKQINLQASSPMNKIEIAGDVVSTSPYKVCMINKINDIETFRSDVTVDQKKKAFTLNVVMDSESVTVSAKYPNSTTFQADVTHRSMDLEHRKALLAVRLNSSRLMHTRLSWRPQFMEELRVIFLEKAVKDALNAKMALSEMNEAVRDEISAKYIAITDEFSREFKPFITALNEELSGVAGMMGELSGELKAMYERNDFYIQDMGTDISMTYVMLQEKLVQLTQNYRVNYQQMIQYMIQSLRDLRSFPIGEQYTMMVEENVKWLNNQVEQSMTFIESTLEKLDTCLQDYKAKVSHAKQQAVDTVYNATYVDYLSNRINQIQSSINLKPYISSFKLPEEYTNAIYDVHSSLYAGIGDLLDRSQAGYLKEGVNEVYQQGAWAYHYWGLEENIRKHAHSILQTLKEIIEDELKEFSQELHCLVKNPITVWDPEHGEIQADLPLPIAVRKLDEMPDVSPLVKKVEEVAAHYLPNQATWDKLINTVSDALPKDDNMKQKSPRRRPENPKTERPLRKYRNKARKFRLRLPKHYSKGMELSY